MVRLDDICHPILILQLLELTKKSITSGKTDSHSWLSLISEEGRESLKEVGL